MFTKSIRSFHGVFDPVQERSVLLAPLKQAWLFLNLNSVCIEEDMILQKLAKNQRKVQKSEHIEISVHFFKLLEFSKAF